jgi:Intracellular proteinase inhibitor
MLVIRTDKRNYGRGETVDVTLVLQNEGTTTREYHFRTAQRFDLFVERDGRKIWQWSDDLLFAQVLSTLTIRPGDSRQFKAEWKQVDASGQPVPVGRYTIYAWIVGAKETAQREISIE